MKWLTFILSALLISNNSYAGTCSLNNYPTGSTVENKYYPLPFSAANDILPFEITKNFSNLDKDQVFGKIRFKIPYKTLIQAPVAGRVEFFPENKKIQIISASRSSTYTWTLYPIIPHTMGNISIRSGDFIEPGTYLGLLDKAEEKISSFKPYLCSLVNKSKYEPSFLEIQVEHSFSSGLKIFRNPRSIWSLPDYLRPIIKKILIFRDRTGEPFLNSDNFFNKPVVRGQVQVGVATYDKAPIYFKSGNRILSRSRSFYKTGVSRVRIEIFSVLNSSPIYTRDLNLFKQLTPKEKMENKFFIFHHETKKPYLLLTREEPIVDETSHWNTLSYANGIYEIKVKVWDEEGNWSVSKQEVLVNN